MSSSSRIRSLETIGETRPHRLDRLDERRVRAQAVARDEPGRAEHAERVVREGHLGIEWGAQPASRQIPDPVERIDQDEVRQAEGHRVDGEVAPRQVGLDIAAEAHLGFAGVGLVGFCSVGRDLETAPRVQQPDGPEPPSLTPQRVREVRDQRLGLLWGCFGREVDVDLRARLAAPRPSGDAVAHRATDQVHPAAGGVKALGHRPSGLENGPEPLGNHDRRRSFAAHALTHARWYRPAVAMTSRDVIGDLAPRGGLGTVVGAAERGYARTGARRERPEVVAAFEKRDQPTREVPDASPRPSGPQNLPQ